MVTCAKLGLRAKYIGTLGDDERGRIQLESLRASGINLDDIEVRPNCPNQSAYILVDRSHRRANRAVAPRRMPADRSRRASRRRRSPAHACCISTGTTRPPLHVQPEIARRHQIPVTVDVDTIYPGFDRVLPNVDYLLASSEFPGRWTQRARSVPRAGDDPERIRHARGRDDAGCRWRAGARGRPLHLFARFRGGLHRHYRRGRRVSWGVLLFCDREHADARSARIFQCHGSPELHRAWARAGTSPASKRRESFRAQRQRRAHPDFGAARRSAANANDPSSILRAALHARHRHARDYCDQRAGVPVRAQHGTTATR